MIVGRNYSILGYCVEDLFIADAAKEPKAKSVDIIGKGIEPQTFLPQCIALYPQIQPQCLARRVSCHVLFSSGLEGKFSFCLINVCFID